MKFILIFCFLFSSFAFAQTNLVLNSVVVDCPKSLSCTQRKARFTGLVGEYRSLVHLKDTLRIMASDGGYQSFSYALEQIENKLVLKIDFKLKPIIEEINVGFIDRNIDFDPAQLVTLKEGDYFETQKLKANVDTFQKRLEGMGFPNSSQTFEVVDKDNKVKIKIAITLGEPRIFKSLKSNSSSLFIKKYLEDKFLNLYNKPFDIFNH